MPKRVRRGGLTGGTRQLDPQELELEKENLSKSLLKLAGSSGQSNAYTIEKVHSGTTQVVSGSLVKLDVDLKNTKTEEVERCIVSLWSQPWLPKDGYELSIECKGKEKISHRHSRSVEANPPLLGGLRQLSPNELKEEEPIFLQSLSKVAAGENGPQYKLSKLISGTKQVVAGTSTKVQAEIVDSKTSATEICELSLWSRPWLKSDGYQLTINCESKPKSVHTFSL